MLYRIPIFLHRESNRIFTVWQHIVSLVVIRQYEEKSYRLFSGWLVEAYHLRTFLQLSHIPHFTTLQKFRERISGTLLEKIIISSSFIIVTKMGQLFVVIDRFIWAQSNWCFTLLYRKSKTYHKKKIHYQTITYSCWWYTATDNLYN